MAVVMWMMMMSPTRGTPLDRLICLLLLRFVALIIDFLISCFYKQEQCCHIRTSHMQGLLEIGSQILIAFRTIFILCDAVFSL